MRREVAGMRAEGLRIGRSDAGMGSRGEGMAWEEAGIDRSERRMSREEGEFTAKKGLESGAADGTTLRSS